MAAILLVMKVKLTVELFFKMFNILLYNMYDILN